MASITRRKNTDRTVSFVALVRLKGFAPVSKSFTDKAEAERWADGMEHELREQRGRGGLRADVTQLTISDLIREYKLDPVTRSRKTAASTAPQLDWWAQHYGTVKALELNVLLLRDARERLQTSDFRKGKTKRAAGTTNRYLAKMRSCWNWAARSGLVPVNMAWPTRLLLPEPRGRVRFLNDAELSALLKASAAFSPAMHAAVVVSICSGLRQGELLRLTWADIDLDRSTLRVLESKIDESRAIYLPTNAVATLKALRALPVVGVRVFLNERGQPLNCHELVGRWKKIRKAAGLANARWHDLRHCAASYLLQNGATLAEVGSVLGHKNTSTTARYAHLVRGKPLAAHALVAKKMDDAFAAAAEPTK